MSAPDDDTLRAMLEGLRCGSVHITADRCSGDSRAVNAFCDLVRAAPALAAEVLRLRAEIERRDADHAEMECSEIERHQRMCAALDIPEEDRAYATDAEVEAAATDAVCERDALAAEVLRLRETNKALGPSLAAAREDFHAMEAAYYAMQERAEKAEAERDALRGAARAYRDATDVGDGEYDATRHADALAALNRVLGGGQ